MTREARVRRDSDVVALRPNSDGTMRYVPTVTPRLRVLVLPSGTKSYQITGGGTTRTIGRHGRDLTFGDAQRIALGMAPVRRPAKHALTVQDWLERYLNDDDTMDLASHSKRVRGLNFWLKPILRQPLMIGLTREFMVKREHEMRQPERKPKPWKEASILTHRQYATIFRSWVMTHPDAPPDMAPFRKLKQIKVSEPDRCLEEADIKKLILWCDRAPKPRYALACFIMIGLFTGMRSSEITTLQRSEIKLTAKPPRLIVLDQKSKTREGRPIPIKPKLVECLTKRLPHLPQASPFGISPNEQMVRWIDRKGVLDLPHLTPNALRHTFITGAQDDGVPLYLVMGMAGHKRPQTTMRYSHRKLMQMYKAQLTYRADKKPPLRRKS